MRRPLRPAPVVLALAAAAWLVAAPRSAEAQAGPPPSLSKSDLVRLTVSTAYTTEEKVGILRGSCLSFTPAPSDWADLRALGADEALLAAVEACERAGPVADATLSPNRVVARAGQTTTVTASLSRAGRPDVRVAVQLEGSGAAASGRLSAVTDGQGRARFQVPAGRRAGRGVWQLTAERRALRGTLRLELTTLAGAATTATVEPNRLLAAPEATEPAVLRVVPADPYGNAVPGIEITLWDESGRTQLAVASTDAAGLAVLEVPRELLSPAGSETWQLRSGDVVLASLPVDAPPPEPDSDAGAIAGAAVAAGAVVAEEPVEAGSPRDSTYGPDGQIIVAAPPSPTGPDPAELQVAAGHAALEAGDAAGAEASFRMALTLAPRRVDAQRGLAAAALAQDRVEDAILWYEVAARQDPGNAGGWEDLGRAYAEAGRRDEARDALARARELDPSRTDLEPEIADLARAPGFVEGSAWGGGTLDAGGGLRRAELVVNPIPALQLWGGWDKSLAQRSPELIRGPDEWNTAFGGASVTWGPDRRLTTAADLGQRKQLFGQGAELPQNVYRLVQSVRLSRGAHSAVLSVGGFLGRWFDRDDWILLGRLRAPIGERVDLLTSLSYGETVGTNWVQTGRHADDDGRLYAGIDYHRRSGLSIQPSIGFGRVTSDREGLTGTLVDFLLDARIPVTRESRLLLFARHQRPPGSEAFTVLAAGLALHLGWGGG